MGREERKGVVTSSAKAVERLDKGSTVSLRGLRKGMRTR